MVTVLNLRDPQTTAKATVRPVLSERQTQIRAYLALLEQGHAEAPLWLSGLDAMALTPQEQTLYNDALRDAMELGTQARLAADRAALAEGRTVMGALNFVGAFAKSNTFGPLVNRATLQEHTLRQTQAFLDAKAARLPEMVKPKAPAHAIGYLSLKERVGNEDRFPARLAMVRDFMAQSNHGPNHGLVQRVALQHATSMVTDDLNRLKENKRTTSGLQALASTGLCNARQAAVLVVESLTAWIEAERKERKGSCKSRCGDCVIRFLPEQGGKGNPDCLPQDTLTL